MLPYRFFFVLKYEFMMAKPLFSINIYIYIYNGCFVSSVSFLDVHVIVLFDYGVSHSFISASFAKKHGLEVVKDNKEWNISIPTGENQTTILNCKKCLITLGHLVLPTDFCAGHERI